MKITASLISALIMILLTGACWGMVGLWVSTGNCHPDEYSLFFGLWLASFLAGLCVVTFAWGGQAPFLAFIGLLGLYGWLMLWIDFGDMVVNACPILTGGA